MFEKLGGAHGKRDGVTDAMMGARRRPRPHVGMMLLSNGYLEEYLDANRTAYAEHKRALERQQAQNTVREALAKTDHQAKTAHDFDRGWRDAFEGQPANPGRGDAESYQRGYRLGSRDRDQTRAKELMAERRQRQDPQKSQDEIQRESR